MMNGFGFGFGYAHYGFGWVIFYILFKIMDIRRIL